MSAREQEPSIAKLFMHGRSQAVRLPKAFRFEGSEVRVRKVGDKVVLEPLEPARFDVKAWRERLEALDAAGFLPEGRPQQPALPERDSGFE